MKKVKKKVMKENDVIINKKKVTLQWYSTIS